MKLLLYDNRLFNNSTIIVCTTVHVATLIANTMVLLSIVYRTLYLVFQGLQACTDDECIDDIHQASSSNAPLITE